MAKIQGPECPECECPDTEVIGMRLVFGEKRERCECAFCGYVFTVGGLAVTDQSGTPAAPHAQEESPPSERTPSGNLVAYNPAPPRCMCPKCKARNPLVKKTSKETDGRTVRYHHCEACGLSFKSVEQE